GIMGFDDAYLSEVIGLTTMYQLLDAKLRIVMVHLLRMIHEKKNAEPEEVLITPRLVVRTSLK
ncbi:MAG: LacI family transcriptional regulator, partial [Spirochaetia bacterium]|nr:LacI family transcriptional regulator [Spirochaetia bacterium]